MYHLFMEKRYFWIWKNSLGDFCFLSSYFSTQVDQAFVYGSGDFAWVRVSSSEHYPNSQLVVYPTSEIYVKMYYSDGMYVAITFGKFTF